MVEAASAENRREMRAEAEATLAQVNALMGQLLLSKDDSKAGEIAIEILIRLEATERGKGWWFRTKRRIQLTQMYLGS
jgi:hypothetical protein